MRAIADTGPLLGQTSSIKKCWSVSGQHFLTAYEEAVPASMQTASRAAGRVLSSHPTIDLQSHKRCAGSPSRMHHPKENSS